MATASDIADEMLVKNMFEAMNRKNGVGIAAPQIGVPVQACIIRIMIPGSEKPVDMKSNGTVMFNPEIIEGGPMVESTEGCLSCPGVKASVMRKEWVRVRWTDQNGLPQEMRFGEFAAKIVQHELDHLAGICVVDRLTPADRIANARPLRLMEMVAKKAKEMKR